MQDFPYSTENEDETEPCSHRVFGSMDCAYCGEKWSGEDVEQLIDEVLTLRFEVEYLRETLRSINIMSSNKLIKRAKGA